jgi:hydroxymethylglutaryl-CoA lyase
MSDVPSSIEIHEEGPREGFQFEKKVYPLADRVRLVESLAGTGLKQIQVASFVSRFRVPQMADAEEWFSSIERAPGVRYTGLWLNEAGFQRAQATTGIDLVGTLYFYASDAFSRENSGSSAADVAARQRGWIADYRAAGLDIEAAYLMTAFGCNLQGRIEVTEVLKQVNDILAMCDEEQLTLPAFYLADTVGWAVPSTVERVVGAIRERYPALRLGLHLHDTRGSGLANVLAALRLGVDLYDASVGGLGGCPFAGHSSGSAGNICTEDLVFMAQEMGIETGVNLENLIEAAREAEAILGKPLAGRVMHAGALRTH